MFGEALDEKVIVKAKEDAINSYLFIVIGTSLTVSPANSLVDLAYTYNKAKIVIINKEPTPYDDIAAITFYKQSIGKVLKGVDSLLVKMN